MDRLLNQKLLIDADCPMCKAYSGAFIKFNLLDKNGVLDYTTVSSDYFNFIEADRSRNEIALYNPETKEVRYGLESLLFILNSALPFLKFLTGNKMLLFILSKLYNFISYNRKVVIPVAPNREVKRTCIPDFNIKYRIAFIVVLGLLSNVFLYQFLREIPLYQQAGGSYLEEFILLIIQFVWHALAIYMFGHKKNMLDYLGQLAVVLFIGGVFLMILKPLFILFTITNSFAWFGGLTLVAIIMLLLLYHRCQIIGEANHVMFAWLIFRVMVAGWWFYEWGILDQIIQK